MATTKKAAPAAAVRPRLSKRQVLDLLPGTEYRTLRRLMAAGRFPAAHYLLGRAFWFADEVEAWLRAQMAKGPKPLPRQAGGWVPPMVTR